jgi:hypothetical protein
MIKLISILKEALNKITNDDFDKAANICKSLGNKEFLIRGFNVENNYGLILVDTEEWTKGKIGVALNQEPKIKDAFTELTNKFGMDHIVYASYKDSKKGFFGPEFIMIPVPSYKTVWSPKVSDIYANLSQTIKKNESVQPIIDSYVNTWPTQPVGEVLVDCDQYYLLDLKHFGNLYGWVVSSRIKANKQFHAPRPGKKADLLEVNTYSELAPFLKWYAEEMKLNVKI